MLRSMYSGISGMKNFQTKLDVIGNNIANVNTSGFKKGRVTFQDMMSQTTTGAQGPTATRGGINASQVGLGSQLGSVDNIQTQGFRQTTNNPLDFSIEGDGMFAVQNGTTTAYTRAGNFYLDSQGNIADSQGNYLIGYGMNSSDGYQTADASGNSIVVSVENGNVNGSIYKDGMEVTIDNTNGVYDETNPDAPTITITDDEQNIETIITLNNDGTVAEAISGGMDVSEQTEQIIIDEITNEPGNINIPETAQSFSVQTDGTLTYIDQFGDTRIAGQIALASFSNPAGLQKDGSNLFLNSDNAGYNGLTAPDTQGVGSLVSGSLEMSNVDLAEEFTEMITAQRGFQANTRIITTSDEILQELVNLKR